MDEPTAPPGLELAVIGSGDNRVYTYMEPELLDMAEFRRSITERFLRETVGDIEHWQPVGILNAASVIDYAPESQNARAARWWRSQRG